MEWKTVAPASRRCLQPLNYNHRRDAGATAFSFAEVMFAVVILGIGFIMIAAIFPVAMQQSQTTTDESTAASIARESASVFTPPAFPTQTLDLSVAGPPPAYLPMLPPTVPDHYSLPAVVPAGMVAPPSIVAPFVGPRWDAIKNNLIRASDSRFAYVPFYRRDNGSNVAQLIIVAVAVRNRSTYASNLDILSPIFANNVTITLSHTNNIPISQIAGAQMVINPDTLTFSGFTLAAEGGTVTIPSTVPGAPGRTYRLGPNLVPNEFALEPPDHLSKSAGSGNPWGTPYDIPDAISATGTYYGPTTLQPVVAYASLHHDPTDGSIAGRIRLSQDLATATGTFANNVAPGAAAPGAFIIIADDYPYGPSTGANPANSASYVIPPNTATFTVGALNGHIYRLGQRVPPDPTAAIPVYPGTYELDPSYGMRGAPMTGPDEMPSLNDPNFGKGGPIVARVFLVGQGLTDPTTPATGYSGPAQDIAVYTTFIPAQ